MVEATAGSEPKIELGPDGKPCKTCTDWKGWSKIGKTPKANKKKTTSTSTPSEDSSSSSSSSGGSTTATTPAAAAAAAAIGAVGAATIGGAEEEIDLSLRDDCPPDRQVLGRATWTFLHTMAAYYPDKPSTFEQTTMKSLLSSFSQFYPCGHCAEHLREEMKVNPPKVTSRSELSWWMCGIHNKVNVVLGKEEFDCTKTDERWRDGPSDGSCD